MKRLAVLSGAIALLALGAVPANAHFQEFQMAPRAGLTGSGNLIYRIWWQCPDGENVGGGVTIRQETTKAPNGIGISCTGNRNSTVLTFDIISGPGFELGPARANAHFTFNEDNNVFRQSRDITIENCSDISWCHP